MLKTKTFSGTWSVKEENDQEITLAFSNEDGVELYWEKHQNFPGLTWTAPPYLKVTFSLS
jgi:hypothetical protein